VAGFIVACGVACSLLSLAARAAAFDLREDFLSHLPDYHEENYSTLPDLGVAWTYPFSSGGFSYEATVPVGGYLSRVGPATGYDGYALSTTLTTDILTYHLFSYSSGVQGVGAQFFLTSLSGDLVAGSLKVTVTYSDSSTEFRNVSSPASGSLPFVGFVAGSGLTVSKLEIETSSGQYEAVDNFIVGTTVPEPATASVGAALFLLGGVAIRRWRF